MPSATEMQFICIGFASTTFFTIQRKILANYCVRTFALNWYCLMFAITDVSNGMTSYFDCLFRFCKPREWKKDKDTEYIKKLILK